MAMTAWLLVLVPHLISTYSIGDRPEKRPVCQTDDCKRSAQRILDYMDPSVNPCDDFYRFSCGTFLSAPGLQDDEKNISITQVNKMVDRQLLDILQAPLEPDEPRSNHIIKNFTRLCMRYEMSDEQEVARRLSLLEVAGGWPVLGDWSSAGWSLLDTVTGLRGAGLDTDGLFHIYVAVDDKDHSIARLHIDQPRLLLSRDPAKTLRAAVALGADPVTAAQHLQDVVLLEAQLAQISDADVTRRDPGRLYNPHSLSQLVDAVGWLDWSRLLSSVLPPHQPLSEDDTVIVRNVDYLRRLGDVLLTHSPQTISNYIIWNAAFSLAYFKRNVQHSLKRMPFDDDESSTCLDFIQSNPSLSLALNAAYARKYLQSSKEHMMKGVHEMVDGIAYEMARNIDGLDWIDEQTKSEALHKMSKLKKMIGYPKEFENYTKIDEMFTGLTLDTSSFTDAMKAVWSWERNNSLSLREEPDANDWRLLGMFVSMVNAMYIPSSNAMAIPAGIMQWPFFSPDLPSAINYGSIGMIIGHEISHGFDNQGSRYDSKGELRNWWKESTKEMFDQKKKCFINQYSGYKDNMTVIHVNGTTTQGENIADNAGMKLSYRAFRSLTVLRPTATPEPALPGLEQFSQDQLFFLAMANTWCTRVGPNTLQTMLEYDPHSPPEFRVNGVTSNQPVFARAFGCGQADAMNRRGKCELW